MINDQGLLMLFADGRIMLHFVVVPLFVSILCVTECFL